MSLYNTIKNNAKLAMFAGAALLATPYTAKADPIMTPVSQVGDIFTYSITDSLPNATSNELTNFNFNVGGYELGSAAVDKSGWSLVETPFDLNSDSIIDGYNLSFAAGNPLSYLSPNDFLNVSFGSTATDFAKSPVQYGTQGGFGYKQSVDLPSYVSQKTDSVPDSSSTAPLVAGAFGGLAMVAAAAKRRKSDLESKLK